jgi:hypothetical protein
LLDNRKISLEELIIVEMLMEIDALDNQLGNDWRPLVSRIDKFPQPLFSASQVSHKNQMLKIWHEAFEWTYYDEVLSAIKNVKPELSIKENKSFQAIFCIDDRECSLRRYIEEKDSNCETFGTAGFFNVAFYYQPENGKFHTKVCPAPVTPKHLIKEIENTQHNGYFTEKIIDCFLQKTIPVYWGCSNIDNFFNPEGIITFTSIDDLICKANKLDENYYTSRLDAINENYNTAIQYIDYPQNIYNKVLEIFKFNNLI